MGDLPIKIKRKKVAAFCRRNGIRKLSLFGPALRDGFDAATGDVEVLVECAPGQSPGLDVFTWQAELGRILGCKVEIFSALNPWIGASVRQEALTVYKRRGPRRIGAGKTEDSAKRDGGEKRRISGKSGRKGRRKKET